jgi:hypothetical protein
MTTAHLNDQANGTAGLEKKMGMSFLVGSYDIWTRRPRERKGGLEAGFECSTSRDLMGAEAGNGKSRRVVIQRPAQLDLSPA